MAAVPETKQYIYHFAPLRDGFGPESMTPEGMMRASLHPFRVALVRSGE